MLSRTRIIDAIGDERQHGRGGRPLGAVEDADPVGDRRPYLVGSVEGSQADEPRPVPEPRFQQRVQPRSRGSSCRSRPGPVSVTSRASWASSTRSASSRSRPTNEVSRSGRLPSRSADDPKRREVVRQAGDVELAQSLGTRHVLQHVAAEVAQAGPLGQGVGDEGRRRLGQDDLAAMPDGGDPSGPVDVEAAVVVARRDGPRRCGARSALGSWRPPATLRSRAPAAPRRQPRQRRSPPGTPRRGRRPRFGW